MALFRVDFSGRGELSERQQKVMYSSFFSAHRTHFIAAGSGAIISRMCPCNYHQAAADALQAVQNF
jgi:Rad51